MGGDVDLTDWREVWVCEEDGKRLLAADDSPRSGASHVRAVTAYYRRRHQRCPHHSVTRQEIHPGSQRPSPRRTFATVVAANSDHNGEFSTKEWFPENVCRAIGP
jgi:hypothetical protein